MRTFLPALLIILSVFLLCQAQEPQPSPASSPNFEPRPLDPLRSRLLTDEEREAKASLVRNYDKFEDRTTVRTNFYWPSTSADIRLAAYFTTKGKAGNPIEQSGLIVGISGQRLLKNPRLNILADGKRFRFPRPTARDFDLSTTELATVKEIFAYAVSLKILQHIATAKKLEMRIDESEFVVGDYFISQLRLMLADLKSNHALPTSLGRVLYHARQPIVVQIQTLNHGINNPSIKHRGCNVTV